MAVSEALRGKVCQATSFVVVRVDAEGISPVYMVYMHVHVQTCSGHDYEVIVIDDNSPDGTLEVAKQLQDLYGEERIVRLPSL